MAEPHDERPAVDPAGQRDADKDLGRRLAYDVVEPVGWRVVIRRDEQPRVTKGGLALPAAKNELKAVTGRVVAISGWLRGDPDRSVKQYDKVLFDPRAAVPVAPEPDNRLFVVELDKVIAILRRREQAEAEEKARREREKARDDGYDDDFNEDDIPF